MQKDGAAGGSIKLLTAESSPRRAAGVGVRRRNMGERGSHARVTLKSLLIRFPFFVL
jgi:hypothetical protein